MADRSSASPLSRARKRVSNAVGVAATFTLFAIPAVLFAPGCQGHQCESDGYHDYGLGGDFADHDKTVWETTPNDADWLPFTPYRTWGFHPQLNGQPITAIITYISADPHPYAAGNNYTIASGNQATVGYSEETQTLFVSNSTCAPFYFRAVILTYPPDNVGPGDAGIEDAGANADLDGGIGDDE